tara:strand:+ start:18678 stop:19097 length:420 start_codon:yes stop_codon:yes gene_type:complete
MKFNPLIPTYGDQKYRGAYPSEDVEHINFVSWMRFNHPEYAAILIHPKNEGKRTFSQINKEKKMGLIKGASDIVIPASPPFICEVKKLNHVKCKWETGQQEYLLSAKDAGAFVCIALGAEAAKLAFNDWLKIRTINSLQ